MGTRSDMAVDRVLFVRDGGVLSGRPVLACGPHSRVQVTEFLVRAPLRYIPVLLPIRHLLLIGCF
jgi:hypothetical protein